MRSFVNLRRFRRGAVFFPRRSCLVFAAVFLGFVALITLLHHAQLDLEPSHEHRQPANEHRQPSNERRQPANERPLPELEQPQLRHEHPLAKRDNCHNKRTSESRWRIWPRVQETEDRIQQQLAYTLQTPPSKTKLIFSEMEPTFEFGTFDNDKCAVDQCRFSVDEDDAKKADVVIALTQFSSHIYNADPRRQITVLYQLESPYHAATPIGHTVNWTATYRVDSTIVTPYEKFVFFDNYTGLPKWARRNYALGKDKKVAWFVSNCADWNGRLTYAQELGRYIDVDVYGFCGTLNCPRQTTKYCFSLLKTRYKFYLAFENSNCRDYITEKLYWNAYRNDIVPVVMGAPREDYRKVAPPRSYIHVDDFASPRELAAYLRMLDADDALYNDYFRWKGTGQFINTKFWCRVCAMAHAAEEQQHAMWYEEVGAWVTEDACPERDKRSELWETWKNHSLSRRDIMIEKLVVHQEKCDP